MNIDDIVARLKALERWSIRQCYCVNCDGAPVWDTEVDSEAVKAEDIQTLIADIERVLCARCGGEQTETDREAGACTQCGLPHPGNIVDQLRASLERE